MDLASQLFVKTPLKTLKLQQKPLPLQIFCHLNNMVEWKYSQLIFMENIMFINDVQAILLQPEGLSEMHFPAIWRPKFQIFFLWCPPWGYLTEIVN